MPSRAQVDAEQEQLALLANDIRVLVEQLNETVKKAAEMGLRVQVNVASVLDIKRSTTDPSRVGGLF